MPLTRFNTLRVASALISLGLASLSFGQADSDYTVPRTAEGLPDISGIWNYNDATPYERPDRYGNREFLTNEELAAAANRRNASVTGREEREEGLGDRLINTTVSDPGAYNAFWLNTDEAYPNTRTSQVVYPVDGKLPALVDPLLLQRSPPSSTPCGSDELGLPNPVRISWGALSCEQPEHFGLASRCIFFPHTGPPHIRGTAYNNNMEIIQTRDHVVINAEMGNDPRIIPLSDKPFPDSNVRFWAGVSRGYFDGDTLVVVTRNTSPLVASLFQRSRAYGNAENRVLTERFTRVGDNAMDYEYTIDDPDTFTDLIVVRTNLSRIDERIYEFACHEGNYALTNMLRAARMVDAEMAAAD